MTANCRLGTNGPAVFPLALGCVGCPACKVGIATIQAAAIKR